MLNTDELMRGSDTWRGLSRAFVVQEQLNIPLAARLRP